MLSSSQIAIRCFTRLRNLEATPAPVRSRLIACKPLFIKDAYQRKVRKLRDAIHHLEEDLLRDDPRLHSEGLPLVVNITGPEVQHPTEKGQTVLTIDRLVLGRNELHLAELASALNEMNSMIEHVNFGYGIPGLPVGTFDPAVLPAGGGSRIP